MRKIILKSADEIEAAGKSCSDFLSRIDRAKHLGQMNESEVIVHAFRSGFYRGVEFERVQNLKSTPPPAEREEKD